MDSLLVSACHASNTVWEQLLCSQNRTRMRFTCTCSTMQTDRSECARKTDDEREGKTVLETLDCWMKENELRYTPLYACWQKGNWINIDTWASVSTMLEKETTSRFITVTHTLRGRIDDKREWENELNEMGSTFTGIARKTKYNSNRLLSSFKSFSTTLELNDILRGTCPHTYVLSFYRESEQSNKRDLTCNSTHRTMQTLTHDYVYGQQDALVGQTRLVTLTRTMYKVWEYENRSSVSWLRKSSVSCPWDRVFRLREINKEKRVQ